MVPLDSELLEDVCKVSWEYDHFNNLFVNRYSGNASRLPGDDNNSVCVCRRKD